MATADPPLDSADDADLRRQRQREAAARYRLAHRDKVNAKARERMRRRREQLKNAPMEVQEDYRSRSRDYNATYRSAYVSLSPSLTAPWADLAPAISHESLSELGYAR
ncbi:hypothetical protein C8F04DRAFT_1185039 [Mycena alexandri]|uniref:BZIP domain-containing protein n=1 Tax=Mycena alexandri TaxID=1745969 RepID=A0AAD6SSN3_9AGAR|nr:hypothetical protein C8F04DRAFT_1185039 [Mycena alexandri]